MGILYNPDTGQMFGAMLQITILVTAFNTMLYENKPFAPDLLF